MHLHSSTQTFNHCLAHPWTTHGHKLPRVPAPDSPENQQSTTGTQAPQPDTKPDKCTQLGPSSANNLMGSTVKEKWRNASLVKTHTK